jgi:hypothetical protein
MKLSVPQGYIWKIFDISSFYFVNCENHTVLECSSKLILKNAYAMSGEWHGYQNIDEKAVVLNWIVIYVEITLTNLLILYITSLKNAIK